MLLKLRARNFKNLKAMDIRFGPFTCFVGVNGVGKSNVLDAIHFLRLLTDHDIQEAARMVRSPATGEFGPRDLFFGGDTRQPIELEATMVVPKSVEDDFGRKAEPTTTLLQYSVQLGLEEGSAQRLVLIREELVPIKAGEAKEIISFTHNLAFRKSLVKPTRRKGKFISTTDDRSGAGTEIKLHQDGGSRGQAFSPGRSPRTVVGGTNAAEYPTVLAARREMASWMILQLEPSSIRTPDHLDGPTGVDEHGGHIAATLERLIHSEENSGETMSEVVNRLAELVGEVRSIEVDRDKARQQLTIMAKLKGCEQPLGPRSLSDGTLRFLALVTMFVDSRSSSLLCMEEPENGMHPSRVPATVALLEDYCVDPDYETGPDNPLRQVVINTHSPDVVRQLGIDDVLFVESIDSPEGSYADVRGVRGGWRKEGNLVPPRRMADFIGGSLPGKKAIQLDLELSIGTLK
jgi:predicted ATPase